MMLLAFVSVASLAQDVATFDFAANPWGYALGSGSGATAEVGNINEALLADDGATSISFDQGSAGTPARFWTGPQVRCYKGSTVTITAAAGKEISQITVIATGASYLGIANTEFTANGAESSAVFTSPVRSATLNISATTRWQKIKVSYGKIAEPVDISNTAETAYTPGEACNLIAAGEGLSTSVYVKGQISEITEISVNYGNATYTISDASGSIKVFRGYGLDGAKFESEDALHPGDDVIVYGQLQDYNGTNEIAQGSKLVSLVCNYTPGAGEDQYFGEPLFEVLSGAGVNVKFTFPESTDEFNKEGVDKTVVLYEDGQKVAEGTFGFQMSPTFFYGAHFDYEPQAGKEYSIVFPAGCWRLYTEGMDGLQTTIAESDEQTYTWISEGSSVNPGQGGNDGEGWRFASVTPAEGAVESLSQISFGYPDGVLWANESANLEISGPNGKVAHIFLMDNFAGACAGNVLDEVLTAPGTYTLTIPAGTFTAGAGDACAAMTYTWTIGGSDDPTPGTGTGTDGEKWQEKIFAKGTAVAIPLNIETEGVTVTSVGRPFMDTTIDVAYNTYGEGELDWNNGTKLVFTAKDNITGIVFQGNFLQFASADKGTYVNGAWSGTLLKGETLTLTANDGIHIHSAVVLYNGAELKIDETEEQEGKISVAWPAQNEVIASIAQGGVLTRFTTNKDYAIVTIELKNNNSFYASHDLQIRMYDGQKIGEGVAKDIEHVVNTAVPNEKSFQLYKGDSYTLILKAFVNQWDVQTDLYDAIAEIAITGDGIEHEKLSAVKLVSMTPAGSPLDPGKLPFKGGKVKLVFDGTVTSVTAVNARGMEGSKTYRGTQADTEGKVWEIALGDLSSLASAETETAVFNLDITAKAADGVVIFDETKDDYRLEAAWVLVDEVPVETVATLTIGGETITLSEEEAVELAVYPAGAVITLNNTDESVKKVTYEIIDKTLNEILKSQGDLTKGGDGLWRAEMPKDYALAKGHDFAIHVRALDGMSSFTSKVVAEYEFLLKGTADVKQYSAVHFVSVTPDQNEVISEAEPVLTFTFDGAVAQLSAAVNVAQMDTRSIPAANISSNADKTVWTVKVPTDIMKVAGQAGSLSMHIAATDGQGNYVYDKDNSVGTPEKSYISFSWTATVGLPTPELAEKEVEVLEKLTFKYDGIGLNENKANATWQDIVILKDGVALNLTLTEDMFEVQGEDAGNALVLTLPEPLYKGLYTIQVPAMAFMLGHDQTNTYNGSCQFTVTVTKEQQVEPAGDPEIVLNITKSSWSKIGSESGEAIGTAELKNAIAFDHIEAEIRCQEDPDQYISFANLMQNGGQLKCYCWEGGSYTLNKGYHYTLTVKAFDVPYYGVAPIAVATYEFVGTGAEAVTYNADLHIAQVGLTPNALLVNGYELNTNSFDVTFSESVSRVKAWGAMGMDGSVNYSAQKKSDDGTVWTIILNDDVLNDEGAINLMIQAWDAKGVQAKGENGDHAFGLNLILSQTDAIRLVDMAHAKVVYTLGGARIPANQMKKGQVYVINGMKVMMK